MHKVFIDGQAGTTGLLIRARLDQRKDIDLVDINDSERKDESIKQEIIKSSDVVILCLPDDAAKRSVELAEDAPVKFIDASTAHRVDPSWDFGLPELAKEQRHQIQNSKRVSNPGCWSTAFLLAMRPLIDAQLLSPKSDFTAHGVSGYSGGGRTMIEDYEERATTNPDNLWYARPYSLQLQHKHLPEMQLHAGLARKPMFMRSVGHFHQGMLVNIPVTEQAMDRIDSLEQVHLTLQDRYKDEPCVTVHKPNTDDSLEKGFLDPQGANHTNRIDLFVYGNSHQMLLIARLDNLGKGASGAAVQNLNLMLGVDELTGLSLS
ncbi:MAG: N-acetyl-gamma-glutamyl-phosphate reductase [Gammaproteobacteria bacterium]|nr:N-acetyl-gamma-glutamyl-phosphate reductase [Gammaproteobacteria bacterium]